jgi:hypothetical protein
MAMQIKRGVEVLLYWNEQKKLKQEERMREEGRKLIEQEERHNELQGVYVGRGSKKYLKEQYGGYWNRVVEERLIRFGEGQT